MKISFIIFILLFIPTYLFSQVTSNPGLPTDAYAVTITFDASQGSKGLINYTGDVYAHTGVITNLSTSGTDWKYVIAGWTENTTKAKMTRISANRYQLTIGPSIREFYGVPQGETIKKMAFVFRNEDGTKTGKTSTGGDIFVDLKNLDVTITSPTQNPYFINSGENFDIQVTAKEATNVKVFIDNVEDYSTSSLSFTRNITTASSGSHLIRVEATDGTLTVKDSMYYLVRSAAQVLSLPAGLKDGINYIDDQTVTLVLHAPYKNSSTLFGNKNTIYVVGDFNNWTASPDYIMNMTSSSPTDTELRFWITLSGLIPGKEYLFQYLVNEDLLIADPYADKVSDPWNDKYINDLTYPGLVGYPFGKTLGITSVFQTAQVPYSWKVTNFTPPKVEDLVIYELLIRDFTEAANYQTMIDTLPYFKRLGINAIELMPVNEFEGNNSWGYNPSFYFAPDKAYGTKDKLKEFIDSCHANGIAVIIDMVLNHSYGQSPLVKLYFDPNAGTYGQPTALSPWYNQTSPNPVYSWGYDFNHESIYTRQFIDRVNSYWLTEYKVDGFRFDFTKGFTNTAGDGWAYDPARISILKRMHDQIKLVNPEAYVILEHLADNVEEKTLSDYGMLLWGNINYNFNEATMGYNDGSKSDFSWASYKQRGWTKPNLVAYMESHDEERLMYKNIKYGNSSGSYNIKYLETALARVEMAACFYFAIPGPKMIWQFGELGYDYSINYPGTDEDPRRVDPKPIKWEYYSYNDRYRLYQVFQSVINLKTAHDVFETSDYSLEVGGSTKWIRLNGDDMDVLIIGNFGVTEVNASLKIQYTGTWYDYFNGSQLVVNDVNQTITLKPGQYHIFTSVQLQKPDIVAGVNEIRQDLKAIQFKIYPNPAHTHTKLSFNLDKKEDAEISIFDLSGKKIKTLYSGVLPKGENLLEWDLSTENGQKAAAGIYLVKLSAGQLTGQSLLIVK